MLYYYFVGNVRNYEKVRAVIFKFLHLKSAFSFRKNINPSSLALDSDMDKGSPRIQHHSLKLRSFELPLAAAADRNGMFNEARNTKKYSGASLIRTPSGPAILSFVESFYRVCIHEYFRLVLSGGVCPLLECLLSEVLLQFGTWVH